MGFLAFFFTLEKLGEEGTGEHQEVFVYALISSLSVPSESGVGTTVDLAGTERQVRVLQKAMRVLLGVLQNFELMGLSKRSENQLSGAA